MTEVRHVIVLEDQVAQRAELTLVIRRAVDPIVILIGPRDAGVVRVEIVGSIIRANNWVEKITALYGPSVIHTGGAVPVEAIPPAVIVPPVHVLTSPVLLLLC